MNDLNPQQRSAIMHNTGPLLVIAGAGTGKTRVITERIAYILKEKWAEPHQILGLTFTEKAAQEMEERLDLLMPLGYPQIALETFHAFCDRILRSFGADIGLSPDFKILEGVRQWQFLREHLFSFSLDYYRPLGNPTRFVEALYKHFMRLKEELVSPPDYQEFAAKKQLSAKTEEEKLDAQKWAELARAYEQYQDLLIEKNFLDFADLQSKTIELFEKRPNILKHLQETYRYVLVDEYQDTNIAQNRIVDLLCARHRNLMAVGDDDQSIYKFRGAAISNILQFEENYPDLKKVVLTENYRSSQAILNFAYASIQNNNPDRLEIKASVDKHLTGLRPGDDQSVSVIHCSTLEQETDYVAEQIRASEVPLSEIAVLCRTNAYAKAFIETLRAHRIPYQFPSEKGLYGKKEIMDLIAVLRVLANPADDVSFYRVLRMPVWNIPMETIVFLIHEAKKSFSSLWNLVKKNEGCRFLADTLKDVLEYSKTHTAGETLYRFTETIQLYEHLLRVNTLEAEEQIVNIAHFFGKIHEFERENDENTVSDYAAYLDLAQEAGENPAARFEIEGREGVQVSTIHAAKGLEFHTVFVVNLANRRFPQDNRSDPIEMPDELVHEILSGSDAHMQEERRLFYVAVTRAKEKLHLLYSDRYGSSLSKSPRNQKRSRFLEEVEGKVSYTQIEKTAENAESFLISKSDPSGKQEIDIVNRESQIKNHKSGITNQKSQITNFSYSQLSAFETCPRQYRYQFVLKIPTPAEANLSFGSALHNTLQEFYRLVEQTKQSSLFTEFIPDLSLDHLLSIYEEKWIPYGYESRQHMELRKTRGREILKAFYERFKNDIPRVKYLEKAFRLKAGDYTLTGRVDRADAQGDGTLEIIDYKTGKARPQKEVDKDLQLMIYAMASRECFGMPASLLTLYFLDDNQKVSTEPTAEKLEEAEKTIIALADQINQSDFTPTPSKIACQFCPYRKICDAAM